MVAVIFLRKRYKQQTKHYFDMSREFKKGEVLLYQFEIYSNYINLVTLSIIVRKEKIRYEMDLDEDLINNADLIHQLKELIQNKERTQKEILDLPLQLYDVLITNNLRSGTVFIFKTHDEIKRKATSLL